MARLNVARSSRTTRPALSQFGRMRSPDFSPALPSMTFSTRVICANRPRNLKSAGEAARQCRRCAGSRSTARSPSSTRPHGGRSARRRCNRTRSSQGYAVWADQADDFSRAHGKRNAVDRSRAAEAFDEGLDRLDPGASGRGGFIAPPASLPHPLASRPVPPGGKGRPFATDRLCLQGLRAARPTSAYACPSSRLGSSCCR